MLTVYTTQLIFSDHFDEVKIQKCACLQKNTFRTMEEANQPNKVEATSL